MKKILLKNGAVALVDDADFDKVADYYWYSDVHGYVAGYKKGMSEIKREYLARVIMDSPKGKVVDHIDRNPLNNQKKNLRVCTVAENLMNSPRKKNNTTGYKGVCLIKGNEVKKWRAGIKKDRKFIAIGLYSTKKQAAKAYNEKAKELFGEIAYQNQL